MPPNTEPHNDRCASLLGQGCDCRSPWPDEPPDTAACRSTMFGDGCGHPVIHHDGDPARACCCCNRKHNLPDHRATCLRCQAIDKAASRG